MKLLFVSRFVTTSLLFTTMIYSQVFGQQNVSISDVNGATPNASSVLDISSTSKGLLIPRVSLTSTTVTSPVTSPLTSLLVYNTSTVNDVTPGYYYWNGTSWQRFDTGNTIGDWKLLGNAGTNAGTNFLGTTDAVDLVFRTNNTEKARILSGGNVGIGESNPQRILHLKGSTSNVALRLENTSAKTYDIQSTSGGHLHIINQSSSPTFVAMQVNGTTNNIGFFNGTPDISASVDITALDPITSSNTRGLLIPRLSLTATNVASPVTSPATSLLVYNSATAGTSPNNVSPGYYYNAGNTTTPNWKRFATGNGDAWITVGNASLSSPATPATYGSTTIGTTENWIGTTDAVDFVVGTNQIERLRVKQSTGKVGIGTAAPAMRLDVTDASTTIDDATIRGAATGAAKTYGVYGSTTSITTNTSGVKGEANGAGSVNGVWGSSSSASGTGVYGLASSTTGSNTGVFGLSSSVGGDGVFGYNIATSGAASGVTGFCDSPNGWGVYGANSAATGTGSGVGVYGSTAQSSPSIVSVGVFGFNSNTTGTGIVGTGNNVSPSSMLVNGSGGAFTSSNVGVYGYGNNTAGSYGVYGESANATGSGVVGYVGSGSNGVFGQVGASGPALSTGVYGVNNSTLGGANTIYGMYAQATATQSSTGSTHMGVYGVASGATNNFSIYAGTGGETRISNSNTLSATAQLTRSANGSIFTQATGTTATSGRIWWVSGNYSWYVNSSGSADYSEFFKTIDPSLGVGEVVAVDPENANSVRRARPSDISRTVGVVSIGGTKYNDNNKGNRVDDPEYINVGMLGQVPVLVTLENGNIQPGDPLTLSRQYRGRVTKAIEPCRIIGYALTHFPYEAGETDYEVDILGGNALRLKADHVMCYLNCGWWEKSNESDNDGIEPPKVESASQMLSRINSTLIPENKNQMEELERRIENTKGNIEKKETLEKVNRVKNMPKKQD